ncbi:iron complex outermembrane receptor protein [Litorimonas taeanensis]|uniref:Iron complex outermembrane receptor protein n=2 Tax=Litorimonas taeanensis TaxID=568099 RepID=A0A420WCU7_9PROT|nr:iron complex outermembrane receptor protein [Litorimonas taeanensis]
MAVSHPAYAQTSEDEIVTTGIRQAYQGEFETLEVPQINQAITSELLEDAGAFTLDAALDLSASVARQNNFGGLWNSFSIRGFSGDINLPSGFLVNGFNAGRGFAGPRDIVGIETVEVLKGPRSALYGRGEPGGTINLVTKRPTLENGGYVQASYGSWNEFRVEGDSDIVFGDGSAGLRLIGFFEDAESFRDEKETQKYGFYPSLRLDLGEASTISYELEYTKQELPQDRGVIYSEEFGYSPRELFVGEPDALIDTEVLGHRVEFQHDFSDDWSVLLGAGYRETSLFGDAYETNFGSRQPYFVDGETISRFFRFRDYETDYFVLRGEVTGEFNTGGLKHRLIAGVDYDSFDNDQVANRFRQGSIGGAASSSLDAETYLLVDVDNPQYGLYDRPDAALQIDRFENLSGIGLYFQDQIDLTDKFQIRFGGRYDSFDQELDNRSSNVIEESSNDYFSPQFGAVYRATDAVSVYASYGEGIRQLSGNDPDGNAFDPNKTKSAEFGVKADLGGLFQNVEGTASATLFKVEQSNILVFGGNFTDPIPAGEAESKGLELDANLIFENDISLWLSYAYTDGEYTNQGVDTSTFTEFEPGSPLVNSPDHQLSLQMSKGFEFAEIPAELGGGILYVGARSGELGTDYTLPDYLTVRLFGEVEPIENIALRLSVDNLFDETYYTDSFASVWTQPGAPRSFRVSARYSF